MENALFDTPIHRRGTDSYKWDTAESRDVQPMWVADMDFLTAPVVRRAVEEVAARGHYGYVTVPPEFFQAVTGWFGHRHGWSPAGEDMLYTSGVVPAISAIIKALTRPGDGVAVLTPAFGCFYSSIRNNRCRLVSCPLVIDPSTGRYGIDWEGLDGCLGGARLMIVCNPHNPGGRVWTAAELARIAELCHGHGVTVISDEIHCELVYRPWAYTPMATVDPEVIACVSPSKAFNTAGLQIAVIVCRDATCRQAIDRAINDNEVCDVNPFGVRALMAAYSAEGARWLDSLVEYLDGNRQVVDEALVGTSLVPMPLQGTYLAWLDCRATGESSDQVGHRLHYRARVRLSPGTDFGPGGEGWLRLNFALPRQQLRDALAAIVGAL